MAEAPGGRLGADVDPSKAPFGSGYLRIAFAQGVPTGRTNGEALGFAEIVRRLDQRAGSFGVGRLDMIEDRVVGIKSGRCTRCPRRRC